MKVNTPTEKSSWTVFSKEAREIKVQVIHARYKTSVNKHKLNCILKGSCFSFIRLFQLLKCVMSLLTLNVFTLTLFIIQSIQSIGTRMCTSNYPQWTLVKLKLDFFLYSRSLGCREGDSITNNSKWDSKFVTLFYQILL